MRRPTAVLAAVLLAVSLTVRADAATTTLLNASYDPTREFYADFNAHFSAYWKKKTGQDLVIQQSHGGSGSQARAVIEGLEADVVTLALAYDIDAIAQRKLIATNWSTRLPEDSTPYTSTVVLLVRKGNPKHIRDWGDVVQPGVAVISANPKTSGGARWNFLAAYSYALKRNHNDAAKARAFVAALYKNVVVLDAASRASTVTFVERGIGDVLVAWENEAFLAMHEHPGQYQLIVPSVSILAEPPVAWVDANVAKHGTTAVARAYLQYLYTEDGQRVACKWGYRPRMVSVMGSCGAHFPRLDLTTIANFGGWDAAQQRFFADGGMFDQIYQSKVIPGRGLALGLTVSIVSLVVVIPLAAIVLTLVGETPAQLLSSAFSPRALAGYRLTFGCALVASAIDVVAGGFIAAVLVRPQSPGMHLLDALIDVPFALPTAVTGITLATLYGPHGWLGAPLARAGIAIAYTPAGIVLALAFVGLPFVVRTVQPIIASLPRELSEAAGSLGTAPLTILRRVTLPLLAPAFLTGFALALARGLGEYGSVIFIAGNMPLRTEIAPLVIITRLEEYDFPGAAAIAVVLLIVSFVMLLAINALQRRLIGVRVVL